jgi:hypothetical protein
MMASERLSSAPTCPYLLRPYFFFASPVTAFSLCAPLVTWTSYPSCADSQTSATT